MTVRTIGECGNCMRETKVSFSPKYGNQNLCGACAAHLSKGKTGVPPKVKEDLKAQLVKAGTVEKESKAPALRPGEAAGDIYCMLTGELDKAYEPPPAEVADPSAPLSFFGGLLPVVDSKSQLLTLDFSGKEDLLEAVTSKTSPQELITLLGILMSGDYELRKKAA